jgi:hypothetical protein
MAARDVCWPLAAALPALACPRAAACTAACVAWLAFWERAPWEVIVWPRPWTVAAVMPAPARVLCAAVVFPRAAACTAACAALLPLAVRVSADARPASRVRWTWARLSAVLPARTFACAVVLGLRTPVLQGAGRGEGGAGRGGERALGRGRVRARRSGG